MSDSHRSSWQWLSTRRARWVGKLSYALITPSTPTKAYRDAGYFECNGRAIQVLIDRDAIESRRADAGAPWQY